MTDVPSKFELDRQHLVEARNKGLASRLAAYTRLSGPGWLQSAITLGGGSLASSLIMGILGGFSLLWVQPVAMILGIIMLSAIGFVTLSTNEQPFQAIRDHVNPVLAWGWVLAVAAANIVWCLPQYALANAVLSQNLLPGVLGPEGTLTKTSETYGTQISMGVVSATLLVVCTLITWSYGRGGWGIKLYETLLKCLVATIVLCFIGVVAVLASKGAIDWGQALTGLVPRWSSFWRPADQFTPFLHEMSESARDYWTTYIVEKQQDVIFSAAATAVGINMTFLFPYSLLRKGWTKEFKGLAIFDLSTGMFIPYVIATGCVVIASAAQFHATVTEDFTITTSDVVPPPEFENAYYGMLESRMYSALPLEESNYVRRNIRNSPAHARQTFLREKVTSFIEDGGISLPEMKIAAALVQRQSKHLSGALAPLTGPFVADIVFGFGVLAMALSTISLLMLISGFVVCEMFGLRQGGWPHRLGSLVAGVAGAFGPFVWSGASFYLAVPTSVFGLTLLPFAYISFFLLMNQKQLLKDQIPRGGQRWLWNTLMFIAAAVATSASLYVVIVKTRGQFGSAVYGVAGIGVLILLIAVGGFLRGSSRS
jgi:Mn2+/Fe2+ NRAMP family transporter